MGKQLSIVSLSSPSWDGKVGSFELGDLLICVLLALG